MFYILHTYHFNRTDGIIVIYMATKHKFNEYDEAKLLGALPVPNNKFCNVDMVHTIRLTGFKG